MRAQRAIRELDHLGIYADQLVQGEETVLRVAMGDVCSRPHILSVLSRFLRDEQEHACIWNT